MIKLYDYELSGNCYKLRLFMNLLGLPYERVPVEFYPSKEHKSREFLRINPLGQLPVLVDDGLVLRDAQAILVYLASQYDDTCRWYPTNEPRKLGVVNMWLSFADGITSSASAARLHDMLFYPFDIDACRERAHELFAILDEHLWLVERDGGQWICGGDTPTIADIANFPYVMLAEDGGISRSDYRAINRWLDRTRALPGFIVMPGIFPIE